MGHPFKDTAAASVAAVFSRLGADALFTPAGGGPGVPCKCVPGTADVTAPFDLSVARLIQTQRVFDILRADVGERPEQGATISLVDDDGEVTETYTLTEAAQSRDRFSLVWSCAVGEPQ